MGDGRQVYLVDTSNAGQRIAVTLADGASMSRSDAQAVIDAAASKYGAEKQWATDDVIALILPQCPDLFNEYYMNQQAPTDQ